MMLFHCDRLCRSQYAERCDFFLADESTFCMPLFTNVVGRYATKNTSGADTRKSSRRRWYDPGAIDISIVVTLFFNKYP